MTNASSRLVAALVVLLAAIGARGAEPAAQPNSAVDYHFSWLEATSAIADISRTTLAFDADKPDAKAVKALTEATDRLENATSALLRAVPPVEGSRLHVIALPRLLELVGAARETLHVLEGDDKADIAASFEWLNDSLLQLQKAVRKAAASPQKSATAGK